MKYENFLKIIQLNKDVYDIVFDDVLGNKVSVISYMYDIYVAKGDHPSFFRRLLAWVFGSFYSEKSKLETEQILRSKTPQELAEMFIDRYDPTSLSEYMGMTKEDAMLLIFEKIFDIHKIRELESL